MVARQVARPVPGHRDGPRGPYGGVGGRLAASARIHRFSRRVAQVSNAVSRPIVSSISASVVRGLIVHSRSTVRPRRTVELGAA